VNRIDAARAVCMSLGLSMGGILLLAGLGEPAVIAGRWKAPVLANRSTAPVKGPSGHEDR
jgi:hypothetical protein